MSEVNCYGEKKTVVESAGSRLTELSRKEDCDVVHNLIMTVHDRYRKLHQRATERGRTLEDVKKNAKQVEIQNHQIFSEVSFFLLSLLTILYFPPNIVIFFQHPLSSNS